MQQKSVGWTSVDVLSLSARDQRFGLIVVLRHEDPDVDAGRSDRKTHFRDLWNGPDRREQAHDRRDLVHLVGIEPRASAKRAPAR